MSVTSAKIANGTLTNTQVASDAAIAYSKLASLSTGQILAGNSGTPTAVTLGGDATIDGAGALTIANSAITSAKIANGTITSADLSSTGGSEAVATTNIQANAVTAAKIANDAINSAQVADASSIAGVGLKQADVGTTGTISLVSASYSPTSCITTSGTATGVASGDYVLLSQTSSSSLQVAPFGTAANSVTVQICNPTPAPVVTALSIKFVAIH